MHETPRSEDAKSRSGDKWAPLLGFLTLILLFATLSSLLLRQRLVVWIFLVLGIASLTAFVILKRQAILRFFVSRQVRYGTNVGVAVLLVTGIAVIANVIVVQRFDTSTDWTSDKIYTLSDQTKKILHGLDREIQVIAFFSLNPTNDQLTRDRQRAEYLLEMYQHETDKLTVEFVDPYAGAMRSQEYEIQFDGTTVFESGGVREQITTVDEQKFTSAILKVVRDESLKIYFLTGHEGQTIDDFEQKGYSQTTEELEKQNYRVGTLSLVTQPEVPADCAALIIPGPKAPLMAHEVNAISKYLDKDGKLFLMLDSSLNSAKESNQGLVDLMNKWGVIIGNDLVLDRIRPAFFLVGGSQPEAPTLSDFEFHQITQEMYRPVTFQLARSVTPKTNAGSNLNIKSLVKTTDEVGGSWGETKRKADGTFEPDLSYTEGEDTPPPVSLAVAVQRDGSQSIPGEDQGANTPEESKTRIVVVGDSDFANNFFFHGTGGGDFFLNAVNWLTLEEDLIAIRPVDPAERSLRMMTPHEVAFVQMTAIFLIPLIIFLIGVGVWWRRR
ncbi:hypothetical protein F4X33_10095 [Candidatus Poribacteria bacterium]|nr:hypothetical protein [Candidatus Poribacteria bacterium]